MIGQIQHEKEKGVEGAQEASNLKKEEKTRLVLWKVLRRKEADEEIHFIVKVTLGYSSINIRQEGRIQKVSERKP